MVPARGSPTFASADAAGAHVLPSKNHEIRFWGDSLVAARLKQTFSI
jgi:hypothetical protein